MNTREAEQAITAILREFEESNQVLVDSVIITEVTLCQRCTLELFGDFATVHDA